MRHTPGPWHLSPTGRYVRYNMSPSAGLNVCDMEVFGGPREEYWANALLIAAAPELLAAAGEALVMLEVAMDHLSGWHPDQFRKTQLAVDGLRQAILKAVGKETPCL